MQFLRSFRSSHFSTRRTSFRNVRHYAAGEKQDVVIIGGGPGGYVAAIKAAQLGLKTTCVEKRGSLGGTCLNVGCIPSKALLNASHMYHDAAHSFANYGVLVDNPRMDVSKMMAYKSDVVKKLCGGVEMLFKKNKVEYAKGHGKILSPNEVEVVDEKGQKQVINTNNIIIATGSDIISLPGLPEIDEKQVISSTGALSLQQVPKNLVLVGGGVIGLEMGSVWSRLGAKVTVVEFTDRIAAGADKQVADTFKRVLKKQGMDFVMETAVKSAKKTGDTYTIQLENAKNGKKSEIKDVDVILVAVGRKPYTDNLGLENVGVELDSRGRVEINDHWQTNIPNIYAIGDVVKGPMLAHKAEEEGIAVVENIVTPGVGHVNFNAIPSVIYTDPEVAWVGKSEEELKAEGVQYNVGKFDFVANSRAKTNKNEVGFVKFLAEKETDRVLGAHIIGPNAGELIGECVLLMEYGGSSEDLARTCHAHPTLSEAVKEAALAAHFKPIHQ